MLSIIFITTIISVLLVLFMNIIILGNKYICLLITYLNKLETVNLDLSFLIIWPRKNV